MVRILFFTYGVVSYVLFLATFLYTVGFVGNIRVPKTMDSGPQGPTGLALLINLALVAVFALQHSIMARPRFKRWWTRIIPPPIERSTYVLLSSAALILLFWQWRPMGGVIWDVHHPTIRTGLYVLFGCGWLTVLISTFMINHFDLFGLRQVYLYLRGKPYTHLGFVTPGPYKHIRHPLYVGWMMAFWATPTMTVAHLVFAVATTIHILVAIQIEERDLIDAHGPTYVRYRQRVPMLIPRLRKRDGSKEEATTVTA